jgi:demethylmenaquinone methyltransferase / 2-methoxy-6-polyprenyl-1,4-benzoquinol methylase
MDYFWRKRAAAIVKSWSPKQVLDVATGSGDLARTIEGVLPEAEVTGADFSPEMLAVARQLGSKRLVQADALALPFKNAEFDVVTVAFGLRNMASWEGALREMARVLSPAGHILILDFSVPPSPLREVYRPYLHHVLPRLASWVTGEREAYRYLAESIEAFPRGEGLCQLMGEAGFEDTVCYPLSGGIVSLYTGRVGKPG